MPYDKELDVRLFEKNWDNGVDKLTVSVQQYNNGAKKLQISRESKGANNEYKFAKLGRMTKVEIEGILPAIEEAIGQMD